MKLPAPVPEVQARFPIDSTVAFFRTCHGVWKTDRCRFWAIVVQLRLPQERHFCARILPGAEVSLRLNLGSSGAGSRENGPVRWGGRWVDWFEVGNNVTR